MERRRFLGSLFAGAAGIAAAKSAATAAVEKAAPPAIARARTAVLPAGHRLTELPGYKTGEHQFLRRGGVWVTPSPIIPPGLDLGRLPAEAAAAFRLMEERGAVVTCYSQFVKANSFTELDVTYRIKQPGETLRLSSQDEYVWAFLSGCEQVYVNKLEVSSSLHLGGNVSEEVAVSYIVATRSVLK